MTTLNQARAAVYQRFIDEWKDGADELTPYTFDNEPFDPPEDAEGRGLPWARCSVRNLASAFSTLGAPGNRKVTRRAVARVEIYTTPGTGQKLGDELAQQALSLYEGRYVAGVLMYDGRVAEAGLVDEGRWNLLTVEATFDYEQLK